MRSPPGVPGVLASHALWYRDYERQRLWTRFSTFEIWPNGLTTLGSTNFIRDWKSSSHSLQPGKIDPDKCREGRHQACCLTAEHGFSHSLCSKRWCALWDPSGSYSDALVKAVNRPESLAHRFAKAAVVVIVDVVECVVKVLFLDLRCSWKTFASAWTPNAFHTHPQPLSSVLGSPTLESHHIYYSKRSSISRCLNGSINWCIHKRTTGWSVAPHPCYKFNWIVSDLMVALALDFQGISYWCYRDISHSS